MRHGLLKLLLCIGGMLLAWSNAHAQGSIAPCFSCATKVTLATFPGRDAKCCKPGSISPGVIDCDPLAQDGWTVYQIDSAQCSVFFNDDNGHWECRGQYACSDTGGDCGGCSYFAGGPNECPADGGYYDESCGCCVTPWSPILIAWRGAIRLSDVAGGVVFDLAATGQARSVPWPVSPHTGWLVLDRNAAGVIDDGTELFGSVTRLADGSRVQNGFLALREFDLNADGIIDSRDPVFRRLRLWVDGNGSGNRDGITTAGELVRLSAVGVEALSLESTVTRRRDRHGNMFRWRAPVFLASGVTRYAYDVVVNVDGGETLAQACQPFKSSEILWGVRAD